LALGIKGVEIALEDPEKASAALILLLGDLSLKELLAIAYSCTPVEKLWQSATEEARTIRSYCDRCSPVRRE
jgi:hypothetical protein